MKHFIANQILKPFAQVGFVLAASAAIVVGVASADKIVTPKQETRQVIDYCSDLAWRGVFVWLGSTVIAQLFGGFKEEESSAELKLRIDDVTQEILEIINEDSQQQVEQFDYWAEIEKHHNRMTKDKCSECRFYCGDNGYLNCAVHPELLYKCLDFEES